MIDFYFWTTPNGYKVLLLLEETGVPYRIVPLNISKGEQFDSKFLQVSPNNKIPAIVDNSPTQPGVPISLFESGAILQYLAEKTGHFLPTAIAGRAEVMKWLFWQMSGLGPMLGQNLHFGQYAPEKIPYAIDRYVNESRRLFDVMNKQLANREFIAGDYSIADMAIYPWVFKHPFLQLQLDEFTNLARWYRLVEQRPAVTRAYEIGASINTTPTVTQDSKRILLGQRQRAAAA